MSGAKLYSLRMRASREGRHLSGGERIVREELLPQTVTDLLARARSKPLQPDQVVVTLDAIARENVRSIRSLDLLAVETAGTAASRSLAASLLSRAGVSERAAEAALDALARGPAASGGNMRGAVILDARSAARLEPDQERGIRASRFDWSDDAAVQAGQELERLGLGHFRTREALALASKAALAPGMVAELCWSDDPDYTAGYLAVPGLGYVRFPQMKEPGIATGGRVFFVDRSAWDPAAFQEFLQRTPVLITAVGSFRAVQDAEALLRQ